DRGRVEPTMLVAHPTVPVEYWDALTPVGEAVNGLVARLLGGRVVADAPTSPPPPKKVHTVRVGRETAGRRGKGVTTVFDLPLTLDQMHELAATLKGKCGTGGTVKDARIEIQGDHRDKVAAVLEELGYKVKRAGG
ncbi:MAG: translation initiation factor, partial [Gemmataceae bacterium]|nr:translation initiation factor [Gemmataceae bacterium]